jgi:hypothetical protein
MRVTMNSDRNLVESVHVRPPRPAFAPELGEVVGLLDRLAGVGCDVGDVGTRATAVADALLAVIEAPVQRHRASITLLDTTPAKAAELLATAGVERAARESVQALYHEHLAQLVRETLDALRDRADDIGAHLLEAFDARLGIVRVAVERGITPVTTPAMVVNANDAAMVAAYRDLAAGVRQCDTVAGIVDSLWSMAAVVVPGSDAWPAGNGGKVLTRTRDGSSRWLPDNRTGGRWLSWVLAERGPDDTEPDQVAA